MPVLLPNLQFDTKRAGAYNPVTNATPAPTLYLLRQQGHISTPGEQHVTLMHQTGIKANYVVHVDFGADIAPGDQLTNLTIIGTDDPYPGLYSQANGGVSYWVRFVEPSAPLLLPYYLLYVEEVVTQGALHT